MSSSRWCSCCFYRFARSGDIQSHCKFPVTIIGIISIISMCYYHPLHTSALNVLFFNQFLCFLRILMSLLGHFAIFNTLSYSLQVLLSGKLLNFRRQSGFVNLLTCILGGDIIAGGCTSMHCCWFSFLNSWQIGVIIIASFRGCNCESEMTKFLPQFMGSTLVIASFLYFLAVCIFKS